MRARFKAGVEEGERVEEHTYEQVVEDTKQTLLKLVSKDRAIIDLLGLEQGNRGFMDYLAEVEDSPLPQLGEPDLCRHEEDQPTRGDQGQGDGGKGNDNLTKSQSDALEKL